jgi:hypothetical protein
MNSEQNSRSLLSYCLDFLPFRPTTLIIALIVVIISAAIIARVLISVLYLRSTEYVLNLSNIAAKICVVAVICNFNLQIICDI